MRFFGPNSLSSCLYYITRTFSIGLALFLIFIVLSFLSGNFILENGHYKIEIPIVGTFIHGNYKTNVIITISLVLAFTSVFFFLVSNVFKTFKAEVLFTRSTIKQLKYFTILNLVFAPSIYALIHFIIMQKTNFRDIHNLILHLLIGFTALFITEIFKRGYTVQSENDLTI